jgi:hypothetical protein
MFGRAFALVPLVVLLVATGLPGCGLPAAQARDVKLGGTT